MVNFYFPRLFTRDISYHFYCNFMGEEETWRCKKEMDVNSYKIVRIEILIFNYFFRIEYS